MVLLAGLAAPLLGSEATASASTITPHISKVAPASGAPGTVVTITASNLDTATAVSLGGLVLSPTLSPDGTSLEVTVPLGLPTGISTFELSNAGGPFAVARFRVLPVLAVTTSSLPALEAGVAVSVQLGASGGRPPYTFSAASPLPPGLSLSASGLLSGTPRAGGSATIAVVVTDANHLEAQAGLTLGISPGLTVTTASLPDAAAGQPYLVQLAASGGKPPYTWSIASGPIPGGMLLTSGGDLEGIPGLTGTATIEVRVTDSTGLSTTSALQILIAPPPPPPQSLVVATAGARLGVLASSDTAPSFAVPGPGPHAHGRIVAIAAAPRAAGYWIVNSVGHVTAFGDVHSFGSVGRRFLKGRIVAIAADPTGKGYWLLSSVGKVYGFGSARNHGSLRLSSVHRAVGQPESTSPGARAVGIAACPGGLGYWVLSASGRVAAFGSARRLRASKASLKLERALHGARAIAAAPAGLGYWVATASGNVLGFGTATSEGSLTPSTARSKVVAIAAAPRGKGYWLATSSGRIAAFGSARPLQPINPPLPSSGLVGLAAGP